MYQSILVPLDGSAFSEQALPSAEALARRSHAVLHLVRVHVPIVTTDVEGLPLDDVDPRAEGDARRRKLAYLERVRRRVAGTGDVNVSIALLDAPVVPTLIAYMHAHAVDMTVMTTHGRGGFTRFMMGSTADTLIRESMVPILLLHPDEPLAGPVPVATCKQILIPLDGSAAAEAILESVIAFGTLMQSACTVLRVIKPSLGLGYDPMVYTGGLGIEAQAEADQAVTDYLEQVADRLRRQGLVVQTRVVYAQHPANAILAEAAEHGFDAITLATHGRHGPSRLVLGSTADQVVRGTHLPVLIYHPCPSDHFIHEAHGEATQASEPA